MGCSGSKNTKGAEKPTEPSGTLLADRREGKPTEEEAPVTEAERSLRKVFDGIDADGNGTVSAAELAVALNKGDFDLAGLLETAGMNSHFYVMEQLDANKDGRISWSEFKYLLVSVFDINIGETAVVLATGARGRVANRTTTDVQLEMLDGSKLWQDIDDIRKAPAEAKNAEEPSVDQAPAEQAVANDTGSAHKASPADAETGEENAMEANAPEVEAVQYPPRWNCC